MYESYLGIFYSSCLANKAQQCGLNYSAGIRQAAEESFPEDTFGIEISGRSRLKLKSRET